MVKNWLRLRRSTRKSGKFRPLSQSKIRKLCQSVYKPGSVPPDCSGLDGHSSGTTVSRRLKQPTRMTEAGAAPGARKPLVIPIWSCSRWGFPCRTRYRPRGALLPHHFTLTLNPKTKGGIFSVALSLGSPPPAINRHRFSVEPGLSSSPEGPATIQPTGTRTEIGARCLCGKLKLS